MPELITGKCTELYKGVHRLLAPNPGIMTGPGTNTYIIGDKFWGVIDPGPYDKEHVQAIIQAAKSAQATVSHIFVTHTHKDHSPAAKELQEKTGALVCGSPAPNDSSQDPTFKADVILNDGVQYPCGDKEIVAVATPGHVSNHYCFYQKEHRILLAGDHLMEGSTVVIVPPNGDMKDYLASLKKLHNFKIESILPAHGNVMHSPHKLIDDVIAHRIKRENKIVAALKLACKSSISPKDLVPTVYDDTPEFLWPMAELSLQAHLIKLRKDGCVKCSDNHWQWVD